MYEGVIDDPYGEFFIAENKSLQKVYPHLCVDASDLSYKSLSFLLTGKSHARLRYEVLATALQLER